MAAAAAAVVEVYAAVLTRATLDYPVPVSADAGEKNPDIINCRLSTLNGKNQID